jgi:hypothetical protein
VQSWDAKVSLGVVVDSELLKARVISNQAISPLLPGKKEHPSLSFLLINGLLQLLSGAEPDSLGGGYSYSLACVWIVSSSRLSVRNSKCTESNERDLGIFSQTISDSFFHRVDGALCLRFANGSLVRNLLDQVALIHSAS